MVEYGELRATLSAQNTLGATVQPGTGGGTTDYELLENKPQINNVELIGNKSLSDLGIVNNVQADWNEADSTAGGYIKNKPSIPTKTSDLDNDSDFVSDANYVHTDNNYTTEEKEKLGGIQTGAEVNVQADWNETDSDADSYIKNKPTIPTVNNATVTIQKNGQNVDSFTLNQNTDKNINITVPTKTSDIQNDSGFIQNTVNNLANYYLKSETYTQTEVQALINSAVNGRFEKVTVLPQTGEKNVIYLVPKNPAQTNNSYDEYIWQDDAWELLGSTDIDLSGYVTTTALTQALQSYVTTSALNTLIANYYTKTEVGTLLDGKVDKETGKGLSTNDYSAEEKSKVSTAYDHSQDASRVTTATATGLYKVGATAQGHIAELSAIEKADLTGLGLADNDDVTALDGRVDTIETETDDNSTTVTGNPLSFTTESAQLASDCDITLNPVQDLHGYDKPWVGGAGANLFDDENIVSGTGVTTSLDNNTLTIVADGTSGNYQAVSYGSSVDLKFPAGTYYIKANLVSNSNTTVASAVGMRNSNNTFIGTTKNLKTVGDIIFTTTINESAYFSIMANGSEASRAATIVIKDIIISTTDVPFEPYTNICPISGRASVDLVGCGKNLFNPNTSSKEELDLTGSGAIRYGHSFGSGTYTLINTGTDTEGFYYRIPKKDLSDRGNSVQLANNSSVNVTIDNDHLLWVFTANINFLNADKIAVEVGSNQTFEAYNLNANITFTFGETVYGGSIDVRSGVVTVDRACLDLGSELFSWVYESNRNRFVSDVISDFAINSQSRSIEGFECSSFFKSIADDNGSIFHVSKRFYIYDNQYTDATAFKTAVTGQTLCYELATPTTIQLTPHEVALLTGANTISTDGDSISITYKDGKFATREDLVNLYKGIKAYIDYVTQ